MSTRAAPRVRPLLVVLAAVSFASACVNEYRARDRAALAREVAALQAIQSELITDGFMRLGQLREARKARDKWAASAAATGSLYLVCDNERAELEEQCSHRVGYWGGYLYDGGSL